MIPKSTNAADKCSYQPKAEMPSTQDQTSNREGVNEHGSYQKNKLPLCEALKSSIN